MLARNPIPVRLRNVRKASSVESPMNADPRPGRPVGWIAVSLVLFPVLLLGTLLIASRLTMELGIAYPEREQFALIQALLFSASLLVAIPLAGRLLGQACSVWPGFIATLPFLLAAMASYALFQDVRSGHIFETDHALPDIFVPMAIALLGTGHVGGRVAATDPGRRAWSWFSVAAGLILLVFVALTLSKATAGLGGMFQLDTPPTFALLFMAAGYAVGAVGHAILLIRR